jgi:hypothetical protein
MSTYFSPEVYGLIVEKFSMALTHNTVTNVPTGPVTLTKPHAVFIAEADLSPSESIIGSTWSSTANNIPRITATFSTAGITRDCIVVVMYKK